ncbi:DapA family protein [Natrialba magadii ATCC 43099]|uniref:DapA family protein n=1 Tax=Natrialba magadii (strain ATCC 43099 / DSM 3394 / CCM 3739 / CIP 104546 / IAM 13178 / JCM 8861 / NBRC 102185 / NCIMB 2190 / MS3) TaxID=547559 RepID=D3SSE1_NATMM|nr:dihydrodipicolinate synthase family protein [Natrialba magadii]ADD04867.1 DapA family protein [Natrialba magadii ATCC 43099]ELY24452.1 dihydrodipicolinate synthase [Natrialba magadii ATCC 43099]
MTLRQSLTGITCPIVTPFDERGAVDERALGDLLEYLLAGDIDALFPCGTTGEFASLSRDEHRRVTELTVEQADGEVPVLAGAAATSVDDVLTAIEDAAAVGADAAVVTPPYFHTANDPAGNQQFFETIADESSLPLLLYNIPACTGQGIAPETVGALASRDDVLGLKDSSGDLEYFLETMRRTADTDTDTDTDADSDFLMLQGYDALLVPALRMGADGGVNALSNVAPETYADLYETATGVRGAELQTAVADLFDTCGEYGFAPVTKTALEYHGVIPSAAVRPPFVSVPDDGRAAIERAVDGLVQSED